MPAVRSVLVVGSGAAGAATAILLAEQGISVDVVETSPTSPPSAPASRIQGNALRVLRQLGVWDQVRDRGYAFDTLGIRAPDPAGTLVFELDDHKTGGPDLPATLGMYRPELAQILVDRATEVGAKVRFATTCTDLAQDDDGVQVTFSDGSTGRYDVVIGADGIRSWTRRAIGIDVETPGQRHGHLARLRARARPRSPAPTSSTAAPATSPATARPARTRSTPTSSRTSRTAPS